MCSPCHEQPGREDVSHLRAFWLYQRQHGNQLSICFPCFKLLFLRFKESLQLGDREQEDWDSEPVQQPWVGPEEGPYPGMGPSGWQGIGQPEQGGLGDWGADILAAYPDESQELGQMPTGLTPQNAAFQGLGPEYADWTQGLSWRFGGVPNCPYCPTPYILPQNFPKGYLPPGEPMLLELTTAQEMDLVEAGTWLLNLQVMSMVGGPAGGTYLRHMGQRWVRRTPAQRWGMLLEPDDLYVLQLQRAYPGQDLSPWRLSLLESDPTGYGSQLVSAASVLFMRGFSVLSYGPWNNMEAEEGDRAAGPEPSLQGQGPGIAGTGSWGPRESLCHGGTPLFPDPRPQAQGTTRLLQATSDWEGQAAALLPQPGELLARDGGQGGGLWWDNGAWPRD